MQPEPSPAARPTQFSLRQLFFLLLGLSVGLALVTQLWHVGAVAALYLAGIAIGSWQCHWRLTAASATALLVYVVTYLACWLQIGNDFLMDRGRHFEVRSDLMVIGSALDDHAKTHGAYPDSLGELKIQQDHVRTEQDAWGHPYHYRQTAIGIQFGSLGRDGRPGGSGLDADLFYSRDDNFPPTLRLTLSQFLLDTEGSMSVFVVATIASLLSAAIWFRAQPTERPACWQLALGLVGTTLAAVVVAVLLAIIHATSSGH